MIKALQFLFADFQFCSNVVETIGSVFHFLHQACHQDQLLGVSGLDRHSEEQGLALSFCLDGGLQFLWRKLFPRDRQAL